MSKLSLRSSQAPIRVMLVDDSAIIRGLIAQALIADNAIRVVVTATNGAAAIPLAAQYKPDIIILDIEMPEMDGLTALPKLLKAAPGVRIIMVSTLTQRNADISLKALALGASDCIAKPSAQSAATLEAFYEELKQTIKGLARSAKPDVVGKDVVASPISLAVSKAPMARMAALALAASTGGPQALMTLLGGLKGHFGDIPIFITQHMPPVFTSILAQHIAKAAERPCHECKDGEIVQGGHIYLAPGDFHMVAKKRMEKVFLHINQEPQENFCRPAADPMLRSLSAVYGQGLMAAVLTGMGSDGMEGCRVVAQNGGRVIAQDKPSSVVWGMPGAVAEIGVCSAILPLTEMASYLIGMGGDAAQ